MPSALLPCTPAVALTAVSAALCPGAPPRWIPGAPRKPSPSTLTVPASVSVADTSRASTPPTEPFHGNAVRPELVVAVVYDGTRTTSNVRRPRAPVAAASVYVCSSPPPGPAPLTCTAPAVTADVAVTYSYEPVAPRAVKPAAGSAAGPPCPYEPVFDESNCASCTWSTSSTSPAARGVAAPAPAPTSIDVAPAAAVPTPG